MITIGQSGRKPAFLVAFVVSALSLVSMEQGQAQLYLDIFPSQDNSTNTLWVFSGSSSGWAHSNAAPHIRTGQGYNRRDTHKTSNAFLKNTPEALYALTPLFTATTTNAPLYLKSLRTRLGQSIKLGTTNTNDDITISSTATNVPTLTFTSVGSRTFPNMLLWDVANTSWDDIGPRVCGSIDFTYGTGQPNVNWIGTAIMTNKPIAHFHITTPGTYNGNRPGNGVLKSWANGFVDRDRSCLIRSRIDGIEQTAEHANSQWHRVDYRSPSKNAQ